jgi:thioredoxin-dependent peroxiredoxin
VAYFAASCDDVETNQRFAESLDLDYPILSDPDRKTAEKYGVVPIGERKGPSRWTFYIGQDGKVLFIDKQVKAASHGEAVAKKLEELKVPRKPAKGSEPAT